MSAPAGAGRRHARPAAIQSVLRRLDRGQRHALSLPRLPEFTPERLLTDSTFQRGYETRLGACGAVEPTTLGDGTAAALRQCARLERGWPVVVAATVVDGRGIAFETFPTNVRVLEAAVAVLRGKAAVGGARDGALSPADPPRRGDRRRLGQS